MLTAFGNQLTRPALLAANRKAGRS